MFGIGGFEFFLILLFGFLIFGPDKLPEIAKTIGMAVNKFKKAKDEMDGVIREEVFDPNAEEPFKNPARAIDRAHGKVKEKVARSEHEETFAERKARYDRERAEMKKRAEVDAQKQADIDANRQKMKAEAAKKAQEQAKKPSADELYGNVPLNKEFVHEQKPASASTKAAQSQATQPQAAQPQAAQSQATQPQAAEPQAAQSQATPPKQETEPSTSAGGEA